MEVSRCEEGRRGPGMWIPFWCDWACWVCWGWEEVEEREVVEGVGEGGFGLGFECEVGCVGVDGDAAEAEMAQEL